MLLTIEIGNSGINVCLAEGKICREHYILSTDKLRTSDEYSVLLKMLFESKNVEINAIEGVIISSVVPEITGVLALCAEKLTGLKPIIVGPGLKTGLKIRLDNPSELGGNIAAAAVAALGSYPLPCVTVQLSTACVFGVLSSKGEYLGGLISPGVMTGQRSLSGSAAKLPNVSPSAPSAVIGKNTVDSMQSGLIYGTAAMVDGILDRLSEELGEEISVVATGEWADTIIPHCRREGIIKAPHLVMEGLVKIYEKNRG